MRLKRFKILFAVLSTCLVSCKTGPLVDVCLSFPEKGGFVCVDKEQNAYFLEYMKSSKYVAFSPEDAQKLIESCGLKGKEKQAVNSYLNRTELLAETHADHL